VLDGDANIRHTRVYIAGHAGVIFATGYLAQKLSLTENDI